MGTKKGAFFLCLFLVCLSSVNFVYAEEEFSVSNLSIVGRGENYNLYYNESSGEKVAQVSSVAKNYFNGKKYLPINGNIVDSDCVYDYCVREGIYYADFKKRLGENAVRFLYNGSYVIYSPMNLSYEAKDASEVISSPLMVMGVSEDNNFIYNGAYGEGLNLVYSYNNEMLKENLIIEKFDSLPVPNVNGSYLKLTFRLIDGENNSEEKHDIYLSGEKREKVGFIGKALGREDKIVSVSKDKLDKKSTSNLKGDIKFEKNEGTFSFKLPKAYAIDFENSTLDLEYELEYDENGLIVSVLVPYEWLSSEDRIYPVRVDPSTDTREGVYSAMVYKWDISGVYYKTNFIDSISNLNSIGSGYGEWGTSEQTMRSYIRWSFDSTLREELNSASSINNLTLGLYDSDERNDPYDTIFFHFIDEDYPDDLTPETEEERVDLWEKLGDNSIGNDIDEDTFFGAYLSPSIGWIDDLGFSNSYTIDAIENVLDNSEDLIIGLTGIEDSVESYVQFDSIGSDHEPYIEISYDCTDGSGCEACLDLALDESCDCDSECSSGNCLGGECKAVGVECTSDEDCEEFGDYHCENYVCLSDHTCDGEVSVFVLDSKNGEIDDDNVNVFLNSENLGGLENGVKIVNFEGVNEVPCGDSQKFEVKCSDGTSCDTQYTSIDSTGGLDYDSLTFTCDMCKSEEDIFISESDVKFEKADDNELRVSVDVHFINIDADDIDVSFRCSEGDDFWDIVPASFYGSGVKSVSITDDLSGCEFIDVQIDVNDEIEDEPSNNKVERVPVIDPVATYLNVDTSYSLVDDVIYDYLETYVDLVDNEEDADLILNIGMKACVDRFDEKEINGVDLSKNIIKYNGKVEGLPYNGVVVKEEHEIYVFGNDIDGTIAAVRRLVDERNKYLNENSLDNDYDSLYLDESDIDAISVYDYFHTDENTGTYKKNMLSFANKVDSVLKKETFSLAIKRVLTANEDEEDRVALRMKHINSEMSPEFQEYTEISRPVVLARGLWNNLFGWEDLGIEIARGEENFPIRNTWLIEITGGPNTECDDCPNYDFDDLTEYYWPALIAGVMAYTGEKQIDYVGYSNGCRTGLGSLEKWQSGGKNTAGQYVNENGAWENMSLPANSVRTFVGVGCPGSFEGTSTVKDLLSKYGEDVVSVMEDEGLTHASLFTTIRHAWVILNAEDKEDISIVKGSVISPGSNISINLFSDYVNFAKNESDEQLGQNLGIEKFVIIRGYMPLILSKSDFAVSKQDTDEIYDNIISNNKYQFKVLGAHSYVMEISGRQLVHDLIKRSINDIDYTNFQKNYNMEEGYYII